MKKHIFAIVCAFAAGIAPMAAKTGDEAVLMTVDGKDITVAEFEYLLNKNRSQQAEPLDPDSYLGLFINFRLKVADAEHAGMQNDPAFVREFTQYRDELSEPYMTSKEVLDSLVRRAYSHFGTEVLVSHIMLPDTPEGKTTAEKLRKEIEDGKITFTDAALKYSVDQRSAARGGLMGPVTAGAFPWEFEEAAYSTTPGTLSPVINSGFGYHIVLPEGVSPSEGEVNVAHILRKTMGATPEQTAAQKALIDSLHTLAKNGADFAELARRFSEDGSAQRGGDLGFFRRGTMVQPFDSISFALADGELSEPFATDFGYHIVKRYGHKGTPTFEEVEKGIRAAIARDSRSQLPRQAKMTEFRALYGNLPDSTLAELARQDIEKNNPEYRNLVREYRDGILLFNISNEKVWKRASSDRAGLEDYFRAHQGKYAWNEPKFKGFVILATTDSVLREALHFFPLMSNLEPTAVAEQMRAKFGNKIRVERVIASKGENAIIDNIAFDGPAPDMKDSHWKFFASPMPRIITNPEEAADVQGEVVADYQTQLENDWLQELHHKYKVKVNRKLFKKLKAAGKFN